MEIGPALSGETETHIEFLRVSPLEDAASVVYKKINKEEFGKKDR